MSVSRVLRAVALSLATLVTLAWASNFIWFIALNEQYGGGALDGSVRDGHYYLAMHGTYTEVGRAIWENIRLHELGVFLGLPFVAVSFGYQCFGYSFPKSMKLRRGVAVAERVRLVRASGACIASGRCGGDIDGVGLGGPFLAIEIFPGGITMRLIANKPVAILRSELRSVTAAKWGWYTFSHGSPDITSPFRLNLWLQDELPAALDELATALTPATDRGSSTP